MKHLRLLCLLLILLTLGGCIAHPLPQRLPVVDPLADPDAILRECWPGTVTDIFTEGSGADAAHVIVLDIKDNGPVPFHITADSAFLRCDAAGETSSSDLTAVSVGAWVEVECLRNSYSDYRAIVTLTVFDRKPTLWDTPPALTVTWGSKSISALTGSYSMEFTDEKGETTAVIADSLPVLQCRDFMTPLAVPGVGVTAQLQFDLPPDAVEARCWTAEYWGGEDEGSVPVDIAATETETADGSRSVTYYLNLLPGEYIYEVRAQWNSETSCRGTAYYGFCTELVEP